MPSRRRSCCSPHGLLRQVLALCLAYCAATTTNAATETLDPLTGLKRVRSEVVRVDNGCKGVLGCLSDLSVLEARLEGTHSRGATNHCLLVAYEGHEWAFFHSATDFQGVALRAAAVDRRLGRTLSREGVTEIVCVQVSKPYLTSLRGPLNVRLDGKYRSSMISIPESTVTDYVAKIQAWPDTSTPLPPLRLGVQYLPQTVPADAPTKAGARAYHIVTVAPNSVAERDGLRVGDLIVEIDHQAVPEAPVLIELTKDWSPARAGHLAVLRGSQALHLSIKP